MQGVTAAVQYTSIKYSWNKLDCDQQNGKITGYMVELYHKNERKFSETLAGEEQTTYTFENLLEREEYEFRVAAFNKAGIGNFSPNFKLKTDPENPFI